MRTLIAYVQQVRPLPVTPLCPETLAYIVPATVARPPGFPPADDAGSLLRDCHEEELLHLLEIEFAEEVVLGLHTASFP